MPSSLRGAHVGVFALLSGVAMYGFSGTPALLLLVIADAMDRPNSAPVLSAAAYWTTWPWVAAAAAYSAVILCVGTRGMASLGRVFALSCAATLVYLITAGICQAAPSGATGAAIAAWYGVILGVVSGSGLVGLLVPVLVWQLVLRHALRNGPG